MIDNNLAECQVRPFTTVMPALRQRRGRGRGHGDGGGFPDGVEHGKACGRVGVAFPRRLQTDNAWPGDGVAGRYVLGFERSPKIDH